MSGRARVTAVASVVLAAALAAQALLVSFLDQLRTGTAVVESLYIPSSRVLKSMSLGYTGLMADLYWTRAVQYYGRHRHYHLDYSLLYPLLDITTDLDPHLLVAYDFGSTFVAEERPMGAGDPDAAVRLLEKGIRNNPAEWRLYINLGYVQYFDRRDPIAASEAFKKGSEVPGAKSWMKLMAGAMANKAGDIGLARFLWQQVYNETPSKDVKTAAELHMQSLDVDAVVPILQQRVDQFKTSTGRYPVNWMEMIQAGYLRGMPLDPKGKPFVLTPSGHVELQNPHDFPFSEQGLPPGFKRPKF